MTSQISTVGGTTTNITTLPNLSVLGASNTTTTIVDPSIHLEHSSERREVEGGELTTIRGRPVKFNDLLRVFEEDDNFEAVTIEQIKRVKIMHDKFFDGAVMNFNYCTLLVVASVIAGLGLVTNSSATIIASMLVGAIIGGITGTTNLASEWPTDEMKVRCTMSNFLVGIPIAFFSGLGVAVALLDDQTNSLVGVAISASLLPPAVNSGIIWVAAFFYKDGIIPHNEEEYTWNDFQRFGWISLGLTLINIVMIWISSMLMFRLKEVLPIEKKVFWSDLGIARKVYKGKALLAEIPSVPAEKPKTGTREATRDDDRVEMAK
ncbi:predicted protein [Thalassiosira pseudonana CCMP1335]|uniref:Uncharacterized protein n=1 Tax=Thalassiosira pseudonana TaxID=35128 RepID=B8CFK2_THAPS|nr:predicted protein [Thalassiosira pseudonana CCMP1335]EED87642.1 predicted protein [Thalassiosira pseudonana CCMP1335]